MGLFKPVHFSVKFGRLIYGSVPSSDVLFSTDGVIAMYQRSPLHHVRHHTCIQYSTVQIAYGEVSEHCDVKIKNLIADMASDTRRYLSPILLFPSGVA